MQQKPVIQLGVPGFFYGRKFGGGFTPEQYAEMACVSLFNVADVIGAPEPVKMQFYAFRHEFKERLVALFEDAANDERTRIGKIVDEHWPQLSYEIKNRCFNHILNRDDIVCEEFTASQPNPVSALKRA